jgi:alpha-L-fucosidase
LKKARKELLKRLLGGMAAILLIMIAHQLCVAQPRASGNRPERLEWFRDLGFGMFIHWNVDGTLGGVISHSLVGAS